MGSSATPPPPPPAASPPPRRAYQRPVPRRRKSWKEWLGAAIMLTAFFYGGYHVIEAARRVPRFGYLFVAFAALAFTYDVLAIVRGRSMVLVPGAIFGAAAVLTFVPDLTTGALLALVTVAAYVGIMLLIAFRKRATSS